MRQRTLAAITMAAFAVVGPSACGGSSGDDVAAPPTTEAGLGTRESAPPTVEATAPAATPSVGTTKKPSTSRPVGKPLSCASIADAEVENAAVQLEDYPFDSIRLAGGLWSAEDGTQIELQDQCGLGDLNGDGVSDAIGVIKINTGGTGNFFTVVAWTSDAGRPRLVATKALGDRTPVQSIRINSSTRQATVVYLTRTPDAPTAVVNVRRTAIMRISGSRLVEVSHTDEPYHA